MAEWVQSLRDTRRHLGKIDWRQLEANARRGTLTPHQSKALLRLVGCVMALLLRVAQRSDARRFNKLLNLSGFGEELVRWGEGGRDVALVSLKECAGAMGNIPHRIEGPLEFVINLAAAIEKLDKLGVDLGEVLPRCRRKRRTR